MERASYVTDTLGGGRVFGGTAYTIATAAGTGALLLMDLMIARAGIVRTVCVSTLFAARGFGLCLAIASPAAAIVGFICRPLGWSQ